MKLTICMLCSIMGLAVVCIHVTLALGQPLSALICGGAGWLVARGGSNILRRWEKMP